MLTLQLAKRSDDLAKEGQKRLNNSLGRSRGLSQGQFQANLMADYLELMELTIKQNKLLADILFSSTMQCQKLREMLDDAEFFEILEATPEEVAGFAFSD